MLHKTINLVYESWNEEGPVVNGISSFPQFHFFDSKGLFDSHILVELGRKDFSERKLSVKICNLDDVKNNPHEKFFCVVGSPFLDSKLILMHDWNFFLLDSTIEFIKKYDNLFFIVTKEHEPVDDYEIECTKKLCLMKGIPLNKFYYVNNNSLSNFLSEKYGVNVKKINFIDYSSNEALSEIKDVDFVENKSGKFFMTRNKTGKPHRLSLLYKLMSNDIIHDVNYSKLFSYYAEDTHPYSLLLDEDEISKNIDLIGKLNVLIKEDDYEDGKGFYDYEQYFFTSHYENINSKLHYPELKESYENSYVNIITESSFISEDKLSNVVHITEKSFRPFYYYQIPLILATPNHIKKLKEKYDFDFFEDIIDHSYDSEHDDKKRFLMFIDEIKRINNNKDRIKEFYKNNRNRFELNKKKLLEISLDKTEDFDLFWNLI